MTARNLALLVGLPVLLGIALWLVFDAPTAVPTNPQSARDATPAAPARTQHTGEPARADAIERRERGGTPDFVIDAIDARDQPLEPGPPGRIVTGRVAWRRTGEPIANCRVSLTRQRLDTFVEEDAGDAPPPDPPIHTYTDRFGEFELAGVPDADALYFLFRLPDRTRDITELRHPPLQDDVPMWQGDFLLEERGVLTGRVVGIDGLDRGDIEVRAFDELRYDQFAVDDALRDGRAEGLETLHRGATRNGQPMSNGLRHRDSLLPYPRTTANRHGIFRLEGVRAGKVWLTVNAPGRVGARYEVLVEPFRTTDLGDVPFGAQQEILATLVDTEGEPLGGYQISLVDPRRWLGPSVAISNAAGEARFAVPPAASAPTEEPDFRSMSREQRMAWLHARRQPSEPTFGIWARPGRDSTWEPVGFGKGPRIEARWPHRTGLVVRCVSPLGPIVDGDIRARVLPAQGRARIDVEAGRITFTDLPPQGASMLVQVEGHAPALIERMLPFALERPGEIVIPVVPTMRCVVEVVGPSGDPLADARVAAEIGPLDGAPPYSYRCEEPAFLGRTDAHGRLVLPAAWPSRLLFHVWHPDVGHHVEPRPREYLGDAEPIRLVVAPGSLLEGSITVRRADPGRSYRVRLARPTPPPPQERLPDPDRVVESSVDGRFKITDLRPGEWVITVEDPPSLVPAAVQFPGPTVHHRDKILAPSGGRWRLEVGLGQDAARLPELEGRLRYAAAFTDPVRVRASGRSENVRVLPLRDGSFVIQKLPYGCDRLWIDVLRMETWIPAFEMPLPEREGNGSRAAVQIDLATGSVTAGLFDAKGRAFAHRMVDLVRDADGCRLTWLTDESGTLQAPAVPVGTWRAELRTVGAAGPQALFGEQRLAVVAGGHCLADLHAAR